MAENIQHASIVEETRHRYLTYALSVITSRALPDVRDGLKPVQRRILYTMFHELHLRSDSRYMKCARIVGDVMGKYHPHGDMAIYDALARMAQDFVMRLPLVDGQGNFGSVSGDAPAAQRYTEAKLTPLADALMTELRQNTVDHRPTYDGQNQEPVVLPAQFQTSWSTAPPASLSAWRPTSRRTTWARSCKPASCSSTTRMPPSRT